ncbi:Trm112 family protein [Nitratidesulfovibrio termitidis]|uniref:Trm112 family protein n=1 Tax=Nitratidesulfovibrio termitidis TaxID=42252 RepID=UPI00040CA98B|nr:Trm112 family protein [Nitratidesulfovibrio termitidis]
MSLNKELLEILVCPKCRQPVEPVDNERGLKCAQCKVVYPVRDEIPVMLVEEAVPAEMWEQGQRSVK